MQLWSDTRPPRRWQAEALRAVLAYLRDGGDAGMVSAIMGAGKTALTSELCRVMVHWRWRVLVSVPSQRLVRQTAADLRARLGDDAVGTYWQHGRDTTQPIIVACTKSFARLADEPIAFDLWIADEAHGTESPAALMLAETMAPRRIVGLSATPYRADDRQALSLFKDLIYEYSARQALDDGVLVPWRFPDPLVSTGDHVDLNDACTEWIARRAGPGIVSANSIEDAEEYTAELCDAGVRAMAVHSRLPVATNDRRLAMLAAGELDCVVHVCVLVEGVDLPWIRWMCLRRRRGSRNAHVQEIGRGLRSHAGKTHCDFFDPHSLFGLHQINDPARLGEYLKAEASEDDADEIDAIPLVDAFTGEEFQPDLPTIERRKIMATHGAYQWILAAAAALRCEQLIPPPGERKQWRVLPATPAQIALLNRIAGGERDTHRVGGWVAKMTQLGEPELKDLARAYRSAYARRSDLKRGTASDLIAIVQCTRGTYVDSRGVIHESRLLQMLAALRRYDVTYHETDGNPTKEDSSATARRPSKRARAGGRAAIDRGDAGLAGGMRDEGAQPPA
jgi:superfamily II DNA or RNA helicase